jgi:hypothetical protein
VCQIGKCSYAARAEVELAHGDEGGEKVAVERRGFVHSEVWEDVKKKKKKALYLYYIICTFQICSVKNPNNDNKLNRQAIIRNSRKGYSNHSEPLKVPILEGNL